MDRSAIIAQVCQSPAFHVESACLARGGFQVAEMPALFKVLEGDKLRLIFPTRAREVDGGVVVGLVCLYDLAEQCTVYAHGMTAGAGVNAALESLFVPATQARPQPGVDGYKARQKFVAWKQAAWSRFLDEELEQGTRKASTTWIQNFWKALDRMYGGDNSLSADALSPQTSQGFLQAQQCDRGILV